MVWFKVDDNLHAHGKIRKVLAVDPAALALWVVAGSWSAGNLTDGFVPDHQLPWLLPARAEELAQMLVNARLWRRVRGGFQFHEWVSDGDGSKRNPSASEVREERRKKAEAGRKGGLASGKTRSKTQAPASARAKQVLGGSLNPRPDPLSLQEREGRSERHAAHGAALAPPPNQNPFQSPPHEDERFWAEHERETRERLEAQHAAMDEARRTARSGAARARAALNGGKP